MKTVDLYILNAAENSDLRDMKPAERQKIEERRLMAVRFAMGGYNIATTLVLGGQERTAVKNAAHHRRFSQQRVVSRHYDVWRF